MHTVLATHVQAFRVHRLHGGDRATRFHLPVRFEFEQDHGHQFLEGAGGALGCQCWGRNALRDGSIWSDGARVEAVSQDHKFIPLAKNEEMTISEMLNLGNLRNDRFRNAQFKKCKFQK